MSVVIHQCRGHPKWSNVIICAMLQRGARLMQTIWKRDEEDDASRGPFSNQLHHAELYTLTHPDSSTMCDSPPLNCSFDLCYRCCIWAMEHGQAWSLFCVQRGRVRRQQQQ